MKKTTQHNEKEITVAVAGSPNTGKSTIFNALTGAHVRTGNWPGVTVERKEGILRHKGYKIHLIDLPGTYSLSSYSLDERIAREYLVREKPDLVLVIVDASNLERGLNLVIQLLELEQRVVIDLNMIDIARDRGLEIDEETLGNVLRVGVASTIANKGQGIENLKDAIVKGFTTKQKPTVINYGKKLSSITNKLTEFAKEIDTPYPPLFIATKYLEGDADIVDMIERSPLCNKFRKAVENTGMKLDELSDLIAESRYGFIYGLFKECTHLRHGVKRRIDITRMLDRVFTNRYLGIPIFLFIMWLVFQLVFTFGNPIGGLLDTAITSLSDGLKIVFNRLNTPHLINSLITEGIIPGIGSVLVFVPNIFILYFIFGVMEESGYMPRAAFVMDRIMHALGLHGKSFIPMILGFGCNVPAILATRTLESRKDRIVTILINPLMSCSARLPIYLLFTGIFFAGREGWVIFSLYLIGIVLAIIMARVFKAVFFKEEVAPLIIELPPYQLPSIRNISVSAWFRTRLFLRKAGTVIFAGVVIIWFLANMPLGAEYASSETLIAHIGRFLAPVLAPAGFGFWQAATALLFGLVAKEVVVGTLGTLYGGEENLSVALSTHFTPLSAFAFMVMSLIYLPCIATIAAIRQEAGNRWALLTITYTILLGWLTAVGIYQFGRLF